jgi:CheY-like chemotaxis protein
MMKTRAPQMPSSLVADVRVPFIVVADDEKRIADTLVLILNAEGYKAEAAHDGISALEICRQRVPDLLLSDVIMPGMNGIELAIAIRQEFRGCQILLFSGHAETAEILQDARRRGFDFELLAKPVHPEQLLTKIKELLGPHDSRQQRIA